jgi:hypothetical protein
MDWTAILLISNVLIALMGAALRLRNTSLQPMAFGGQFQKPLVAFDVFKVTPDVRIDGGLLEAGNLTFPFGGNNCSRQAIGAVWFGIRPEKASVGDDTGSAGYGIAVTASAADTAGPTR